MFFYYFRALSYFFMKRCIVFLLCFTVVLLSATDKTQAQEREYFIHSNGEKCPIEEGVYYRRVYKEEGMWLVKDYHIEEKSLRMEGRFADDSLTIPIGSFFFYHPNKHLSRKGRFIDGKPSGLWRSYSEEGKLTDSSLYHNGMPQKFAYRWYEDGATKFVGLYNADTSGTEISYYADGTVDYQGKYAASYLKDSVWVYNHKNGKPASVETFDKGVLRNVDCFDEAGNPMPHWEGLDSFINRLCVPEIYHSIFDVKYRESYGSAMPESPYIVNQYLSRSITYPVEALERNLQGKALIQFIVDEEGKITEVKSVNNGKLGGGLDEEAIRVVSKMPKWKPGRDHNRIVKVYFTLPVKFVLE